MKFRIENKKRKAKEDLLMSIDMQTNIFQFLFVLENNGNHRGTNL